MNQRAGVIGHPISHSLSPKIFDFLSVTIGGVSLKYLAHDVSPSELRSYVLEALKDPQNIGFNVTVPHKESVLSFAHHLSDEVEKIGAANVLAFKDQEIFAFNTDVVGISESLLSATRGLPTQSVLVVGAGGAARAALYTCGINRFSSVKIINRSPSKARLLGTEFNKFFPATAFKAIENLAELDQNSFDLIVQATPLGMTGYRESTRGNAEAIYQAIFKHQARPGLAFDMIYRPQLTPFLNAAQQSGWKILGGLGMLVGQALATWEIWFEKIENKENVRQLLIQNLQKHLEATP